MVKVNPLSIANLMRKVERMDKEIEHLKKQVEYERELRRDFERSYYQL
jgi:hypothetical protein